MEAQPGFRFGLGALQVSVKSQHGEARHLWPAIARAETNVRVVARFRPPVTDEEEKDQAAFVVREKSSALGVTENATVQSQDGRLEGIEF